MNQYSMLYVLSATQRDRNSMDGQVRLSARHERCNENGVNLFDVVIYIS